MILALEKTTSPPEEKGRKGGKKRQVARMPEGIKTSSTKKKETKQLPVDEENPALKKKHQKKLPGVGTLALRGKRGLDLQSSRCWCGPVVKGKKNKSNAGGGGNRHWKKKTLSSEGVRAGGKKKLLICPMETRSVLGGNVNKKHWEGGEARFF